MYGVDLDHEVWDRGHIQDVLDRHKKTIVQVAREDGYDGIIASHGADHVFVVFEPNQIKSIFNRQYDQSSNDISEGC